MIEPQYITRKKPKSDEGKSENGTYRRRRTVAASKRSLVNRRRTSTVAPSREGAPNNNPDTIPFVSFPVPVSVPTPWLVKTSVMILVKHLLYVRGLLPMTVEQLDATQRDDLANNQDPRVNRRNKLSPSMRRSIRKEQQQMQNLFQEWERIVDSKPTNLAFILISLGPSYNQSQELYLLDVQSLHWNESSPVERREKENDDSTKLRRLEATLGRRLISTAMNQDGTPLHQLSSKASPSFRLWLALGTIDTGGCDTGSSAKKVPPVDCIDGNHSFLIPRNSIPGAATRKRNTGSTGAGIRLLRPSHEKMHDDTAAGRLIAPSDQVAWNSLPTNVKGFRLSA